MRPTNAVAAHSEAHVFFETGDPSGGGDFLGTWLQGFDRRAPYHVHLSWHQALFELARGHYQRALDLYEADIRPEAYLRAEQFEKAEEMLRTRLQRRASVRDLFWLGRAQVSSAQPEAARASLHEVTQRWQDADPGSLERTTLHRLAAQAG